MVNSKVKTISLISIACTKIPETIEAFKVCLSKMNFARAILFTHEDVSEKGIEVIKIPKLDYKGYNEFVFSKLGDYIDTDYILLIQNDGYIKNMDMWTEKFLEYDYIGAPWPIPNDTTTYRTPKGELVRVGNGGFSLRSKKLLYLPKKLGIELTDMGTGFWHEDGAICVHYRDEFIKEGIKYAPIDIAARFSTELTVPETVKSFGGHRYL